jgi:steroid 5-alpha reductase family enzyme
MLVVTAVCFLVSEITRNYSLMDKLWSLLPIAYGWITVAAVPSPRLILMASLVTIWGLRLSYKSISSKKYPEYAVYQKNVPRFIPRALGGRAHRR